MCTQHQVQSKGGAFGDELLTILNHAAAAIMISLGHRTGLFDAMADGAPVTSGALASRAGLSERYVREWLGAMTCARIVDHDPAAGTYALSPEKGAFLTRAASPNNFASVMQWVPMMGAMEDDVLSAFRHGKGIPYAAYARFPDVMAEESEQTVVAALEPHILPLVPEVVARLEAGADVLDVGCGVGRALSTLAARYPRSRFTGYDLLPAQVERAAADAAARGLTNLRFEARDAAAPGPESAFDFIMTFDAVHDQARPDAVVSNIRRMLRPGGVYLCQEIKAESTHHGNIAHPAGTYLYAISTIHCMSVSLAQGGPGLGAAWGRDLCRTMLGRAGFGRIAMHELPHDPMNDYWVCEK